MISRIDKPIPELNIELYVEKGLYTGNTPMRDNSYYELIIIMGGDAVCAVEGSLFPVERGYIIAIQPGFRHGFIGVRNLKFYRYVFDLDSIARSNMPLKKLIGFQSFFMSTAYYRYHHIFNSILILSDSHLELVSLLSNLLYNTFTEKNPGYHISVREYFICLLTIISNEYVQTDKPSHQSYQFMDDAFTYLETHYFEPLTVKDLAGIAHLSERHFTRLFKEIYGSTPTAYIIRCRLTHACELIKNTSNTLSSISEECGFPNFPAFTKTFKDKIGVTPSQYRKQHRRETES